MNIQDFSDRTGISKSALRYYEQKNLLFPRDRSANGYRVYSEDQIATVKLISSLRLVDIPIRIFKFIYWRMTRQDVSRCWGIGFTT